MKICPVILAGGSGSRLWPMSREHYPKQLLPLHGDSTLLQQTIERFEGENVDDPVLVCNEQHRFLIAEQIRAMGRQSSAILLEPVGRNTAPAMTVAALAAQRDSEPCIMVVMPADHVIRNMDNFAKTAEEAFKVAKDGYICTFGIVANSPHTGYGYIRRGDRLSGHGDAYEVASFVEKPDEATAQGYLDSGDYFWNSGLYVVRSDVWLTAISNVQPEIFEACTNAFESGEADHDFFRLDKNAFEASPSDSIDYAVMEKISNAGVKGAALIPLDADWSDVGEWSAIWEIGQSDENGNVLQGDVFSSDTQNSLVVAEHRFVATVGLKDAVVIETADAVMVSDRSHSQDVKKVVEWLKKQNRDECHTHRRVYRPWGDFEALDNGNRYQVKRLTISPGHSISLQKHHHRAEHWIVVSGTAQVTRDDEVYMVSENESTYIPLGAVHRLENPGKLPLEIIEVQSGSYLGEDDIVRYEDVYNRS